MLGTLTYLKPSDLFCGERCNPERGFINGLIMINTLICKIPPNLPLLKGGITPLW